MHQSWQFECDRTACWNKAHFCRRTLPGRRSSETSSDMTTQHVPLSRTTGQALQQRRQARIRRRTCLDNQSRPSRQTITTCYIISNDNDGADPQHKVQGDHPAFQEVPEFGTCSAWGQAELSEPASRRRPFKKRVRRRDGQMYHAFEAWLRPALSSWSALRCLNFVP